MPNRGLLLGIRLSGAARAVAADTAGRKGDPQWHAGDDPPFEEACVSIVAVAPTTEQQGYGAVKTCNSVLKHGDALGAV